MKNIKYITCPSCNGSGLNLNMNGEPDVCRECMGNTVVPATKPRKKKEPQ